MAINKPYQRIKLPKELIDKLKENLSNMKNLELEVRDMERAGIPGADERRKQLEDTKERITKMIVVYG